MAARAAYMPPLRITRTNCVGGKSRAGHTPPLPRGIVSHKRVIKPPVSDGNAKAERQQRRAQRHYGIVAFGKGAAGVPCAGLVFAKAAQLHGVGDGINAVQAGQNQRQQDMYGVFQPLEERLVFAKLDAARLLRLADGV